uniref:Uncharacterized protein n=1 Tax=Arundo donax TaxID=35708 RepID=A0A0A9FBG4_ARUDO
MVQLSIRIDHIHRCSKWPAPKCTNHHGGDLWCIRPIAALKQINIGMSIFPELALIFSSESRDERVPQTVVDSSTKLTCCYGV